MSYEKLNIKNGQILNQTHLAHFEDGIASASSQSEQNKNDISKLNQSVNDTKNSIGNINTSINGVKSDITNLSNKQTQSEQSIKKINLTLENEDKKNSKIISIDSLNSEYKNYKDYILACAVDFVFKDGTKVSNALNKVTGQSGYELYTLGDKKLYGNTLYDLICGDFFFYDIDEGKIKIVRELDSNRKMIDTFVKYDVNTELIDFPDNQFQSVILPFTVDELKEMLLKKNGYEKSISYDDCGAYLDGVHDDRPAVETAHRIANLFGMSVYNHHGKISIASVRKIVIETSTDWSGSEIDITDYNWDIMFQIYNKPVDASISDITLLKHNTQYVEEWADHVKYPPMTAIHLVNPKGCRRENRGEITWEKREELVVVANNGRIMYPPIDDMTSDCYIQNATLYPNRRTIIKGCVINVKAKKKTSVIWFMRVDRSNTEVRDFVINPCGDDVITNEDFKGAIFIATNAINVTFDNIVGFNIAGKPKDDSTTASRWQTAFAGYIFHAGASCNVTIKNCDIDGWWGAMAFLFCKTMHVLNTHINRIDTHDYCSDLFIDNCTIGVEEGYINMGYGHGVVMVSNTKVNTYGERFMTLRSDYGSLFDGFISINNCYANYTGSNRNFYVIDCASIFSKSAFDANNRTEQKKPKVQIVNFGVDGVKGSIINEFYPNTITMIDSETKLATFNGQTPSILDEVLGIMFNFKKSGRVWKRKIWRHDSAKPDVVEEIDDYKMGAATPFTDTTKGSDPYMEFEVFNWYRCNYIRDDDGTARVTGLKGAGTYSESGSNDVGTLSMTFYWNVEEHGSDGYDILYFSDMPNESLGLIPWYEAVKADGTVLPYYITSAYNSVEASDGTPRSQPGKSPMGIKSYDQWRQAYQEKGFGYNGGGMSANTLQIIFLIVKYLTKNSQTVFTGCSGYNYQYKSVTSENNVKRVILDETEANRIPVGGCVSIGNPSSNNLDRNNDEVHSLANRVRVIKKEAVTIGSTRYIAITVDSPNTFSTTTNTVVSCMPMYTGMTDSVIGSYDGSPVNNKNNTYPYRIKGIEYGIGMNYIASDLMLVYQPDYSAKIYFAAKGVQHTYKDYETNYEEVGTLPAPATKNKQNVWIGDVKFDVKRGLCYPITYTGTSGNDGTGDRYEAAGAATSGYRTYTIGGRLGNWEACGATFTYTWASQWHEDWNQCSRD